MPLAPVTTTTTTTTTTMPAPQPEAAALVTADHLNDAMAPWTQARERTHRTATRLVQPLAIHARLLKLLTGASDAFHQADDRHGARSPVEEDLLRLLRGLRLRLPPSLLCTLRDQPKGVGIKGPRLAKGHGEGGGGMGGGGGATRGVKGGAAR